MPLRPAKYRYQRSFALQERSVRLARMNETSWRSMATAPKDGTIIEIQCAYGIVPYSDLYRWVYDDPEVARISSEELVPGETYSGGKWKKVSDPTRSLMEGPWLTWKPANEQPK